jgi:dolichol-phosphate mannosyltransferase
MKRLSIVVPIYNEASGILRLWQELRRVMETLPYEAAYVFVNDGSTDASGAVLETLTADPAVTYVELSRNFGKEIATSAGIAYTQSDAVIIIDADLQHPPELIREFVREWEAGADVVIGVRRPREGEGFLRRMGSRGFASLMNSMGDAQAPVGATDFRLIDKKVVEVFRTMREHNRLTRSLIDWLGFTRVYIPFDAFERTDGVARYNYRKLFGTAFSAIVAHSRLPLYLAGYLGAGITLFAGLLGVFIIVEQLILGDPLGVVASGTAMLATMILFLNGIVLMCLGLVALYIGTIHEEAAGRPLWVVRRHINAGVVE